ncbi:MAG: PAS domain-containing sensor histidine kinase [Bacteroidetes bacterium]|nr:PAS domain-containing sensor histidine kinase [Bacteroidota bacterium]
MLSNDTIALIILSSGIVILFAVAYVLVLIFSNKRIISEQQSKIEEINKSEERYKALFENSLAGMMKFDIETRRVFDANSSMLSLFHVTALLELEAALVSIPEETFGKIRSQVTASGPIPPQELRFVRPNGTDQWLLFAVRSSNSDNLSHAVVIDITEKKDLERASARAQRLETISLLTNSVTHDLQNIFAPILLSIHLLEGHMKGAKARDILETMRESTNDGMKLVRTILSVGGSVTLTRKKINLGITVKHCVDTFNRRKKKFVTIIGPKKSSPIYILGDKQRLIQVFLNLLANANDAMPYGGTITVSIDRTPSDRDEKKNGTKEFTNQFVAVSFTDTGIGISEPDVDRIFEPFYTTKQNQQGTGLGLAFVQNIVKEHGGSISVSSQFGHGATFAVRLPLYIV